MSSQEQIRLDEDWKGVIDPALRKKLQNKLNQRAVRTFEDTHLVLSFKLTVSFCCRGQETGTKGPFNLARTVQE